LAVKCPGGVDWMRRFIWLWAENEFFRDDYLLLTKRWIDDEE
jgi:hypothetical protein